MGSGFLPSPGGRGEGRGCSSGEGETRRKRKGRERGKAGRWRRDTRRLASRPPPSPPHNPCPQATIGWAEMERKPNPIGRWCTDGGGTLCKTQGGGASDTHARTGWCIARWTHTLRWRRSARTKGRRTNRRSARQSKISRALNDETMYVCVPMPVNERAKMARECEKKGTVAQSRPNTYACTLGAIGVRRGTCKPWAMIGAPQHVVIRVPTTPSIQGHHRVTFKLCTNQLHSSRRRRLERRVSDGVRGAQAMRMQGTNARRCRPFLSPAFLSWRVRKSCFSSVWMQRCLGGPLRKHHRALLSFFVCLRESHLVDERGIYRRSRALPSLIA